MSNPILRTSRRLEDLPYRFWPQTSLPPGVEAPTKLVNVKAADFKKTYNKVVNPVVKAAGFKCSGATARKNDARLWRMVWYGTGKYGGSGVVALAAHFPGLPARNDYVLPESEFSYPNGLFLGALELAPGLREFDLGRGDEEPAETARLMAESFAEQALPWLERIESAEEDLLALSSTGWAEPMADLYQQLVLRLVDFNLEPGKVPLPQSAQLLARLNARRERTVEARAFAEQGIAAVYREFAEYPHARHTWILRFERLLAGDRTFVLDAAARAEVDRRVAAEANVASG